MQVLSLQQSTKKLRDPTFLQNEDDKGKQSNPYSAFNIVAPLLPDAKQKEYTGTMLNGSVHSQLGG